MKTSWRIASAGTYGGVILSKNDYVLLREPTNHFDGYAWTFPKGKPDKGEALFDTRSRLPGLDLLARINSTTK